MGVYAVILSGGSGTRLWPRSRAARPKHLLSLIPGERELLRETYDRVRPVVDRVLVVTDAKQAAQVSAILPELSDADLILETAARGTTNAVGLAAMTLLGRDPEALMLSVPADHVVRDGDGFRQTVSRALAVAATTGQLVTVGLRPTYPATGFGYMLAVSEVADLPDTYRVAKFVEKPDRRTAELYLGDGRYFWNAALFAWRCATFVEELALHAPAHHEGLLAVLARLDSGDRESAGAVYGALPTDAVDYTIMERTSRLLMVSARFEWMDVGSWSEVHSMLPQDASGNSGTGRHLLIDTQACLLDVPGKLVAAVGIRDLVVIETDDALLLCARDRAQEVKQVVELLRVGELSAYA